MSLYTINQQILDIYETEIDEDGGLTDEAFQKLQALNLSRDVKIENCALLIKEWFAEAAKIKDEADKLTDRRRILERKAERLKAYLASQMPGEKFEAPRVAISWRKSEAVKILDEALIAPCFWKTPAPQLDKMSIKATIKSGKDVPGATLEEKQNIQIK